MPPHQTGTEALLARSWIRRDSAKPPAGLDVDHAARPQLQSLPGLAGRFDALIQADGRAQLALQGGVVDQVAGSQRLLQHQQPELVELGKVGGIIERVGAVGIRHQRDLRVALADSRHGRHVPARLDFDLDPTIALRQLGPDIVEQLVDGRLDPDADPGLDAITDAAEKRCQWLARVLGERAGERHLDAGLGHVMTPNRREQRFERIDIRQLAPDDRRDQVSLEDLPRGLDRLVGIPGPFAGDALTPLRATIDLEAHQQRIAVLLHAEAGAKRLQQPHLQHPQFDRLDFHDGRAIT
jgi:hypothetical protein